MRTFHLGTEIPNTVTGRTGRAIAHRTRTLIRFGIIPRTARMPTRTMTGRTCLIPTSLIPTSPIRTSIIRSSIMISQMSHGKIVQAMDLCVGAIFLVIPTFPASLNERTVNLESSRAKQDFHREVEVSFVRHESMPVVGTVPASYLFPS